MFKNLVLVLLVAISLLVTVPVIYVWAGFGHNLGGVPLYVWVISVVLSIFVAVAVPLALRRFHRLRWLSPLFSLQLAVLLMFGVNYVQLPFEESMRTKQALAEMPVFPGAELMDVSYHPAGSVDIEPVVWLDFNLPNAQERFCEIAAYYDKELITSGWIKVEHLYPRVRTDFGCHAVEGFSKTSPRRTVIIDRHNVFEESTFRLKIGF